MRALLWLAVASTLLGCPKKASTDTVDAGVVAASTKPINEADITRYPYEKKMDSVSAVTVRDAVIVHKSPPDGPTVATLAKGSNVTEIAQTASSLLITFDDPSSGKRMMGWIGEDAFTDAAAVAAAHGGGGGGGGGGAHGGPSTPIAATDAGSSSLPTPAPGVIFVVPVGGKCPAGFPLVGGGCRKACATVKDCPAGVKCTSKICTNG